MVWCYPFGSKFSISCNCYRITWIHNFPQGLTEEDLTNYQIKCNKSCAVRIERYYTWTDGVEAALCKHKSKQRFHEVALKRCMRSQKQIHKTFPKASCSQRKRAFNKFQNEHRSQRNILSKQKEGASEYMSLQSPHKIGQDYIDGEFAPRSGELRKLSMGAKSVHCNYVRNSYL